MAAPFVVRASLCLALFAHPLSCSRNPGLATSLTNAKQALGLKAVDFAADKYHDKIYDKIAKPRSSSNDSLAKNTSPNDSDSASAEYSDDGFIEERRTERRRGRRGTSDGLGEREYAGQWSGYDNARSYAAPQFEDDASGTRAQNTYPQPVSGFLPFLLIITVDEPHAHASSHCLTPTSILNLTSPRHTNRSV